MPKYVEITDDIIGKYVLFNDSQVGLVTAKITQGNERRGAEYAVTLIDSGQEVYITDMSFDRFKIIDKKNKPR